MIAPVDSSDIAPQDAGTQREDCETGIQRGRLPTSEASRKMIWAAAVSQLEGGDPSSFIKLIRFGYPGTPEAADRLQGLFESKGANGQKARLVIETARRDRPAARAQRESDWDLYVEVTFESLKSEWDGKRYRKQSKTKAVGIVAERRELGLQTVWDALRRVAEHQKLLRRD